MKSMLVLLCVISAAAALPFSFGGKATGHAQGTVSEGQSHGPHGASHITTTSSVAGGTSINGAPSISSARASNLKGPGGTSHSNTVASSIQPGAYNPGLFGTGYGGGPLGVGYGGRATGNAQGTVTEGETYGPQGTSHIINTSSVAGGTSINGAPSFSNAHASNLQGPDGTSQSNTVASSIQPGSYNPGPFGAGYNRVPFGAGYGSRPAGFGSGYGGQLAAFGR